MLDVHTVWFHRCKNLSKTPWLGIIEFSPMQYFGGLLSLQYIYRISTYWRRNIFYGTITAGIFCKMKTFERYFGGFEDIYFLKFLSLYLTENRVYFIIKTVLMLLEWYIRAQQFKEASPKIWQEVNISSCKYDINRYQGILN